MIHKKDPHKGRKFCVEYCSVLFSVGGLAYLRKHKAARDPQKHFKHIVKNQLKTLFNSTSKAFERPNAFKAIERNVFKLFV